MTGSIAGRGEPNWPAVELEVLQQRCRCAAATSLISPTRRRARPSRVRTSLLWRELYDRVGGTAYGLAYRVLRDEALAEDAVQEAFLGLWRSAGSFIPERAKASTWILTLVHRRAVDLVRREQPAHRADRGRARARRGLGRGGGVAPTRPGARPGSARALPDQQREAIELAYYGGYTQSELAERLGQPLGTIKSRMFSGLTRLRELLEEGTERTTWTSRPDRGLSRSMRSTRTSGTLRGASRLL